MICKKNDYVTVRGMVHILGFDPEGNLIFESRDRNLVVNAGRDVFAELLATANADKRVTKVEWGEGNATPTPSDTALTNPYQNAVSGVSYPQMGQVQFQLRLLTSEANGKVLNEVGLFTDDGTTLVARHVFGPITKDALTEIQGTWTIQF